MPPVDLNTKKTVRRFMAMASGRFGMESVILFGSRARGTHDANSDADLAILLNGSPQPAWPTGRPEA